MCRKKKEHVLYFKPYKDTHGINRVITCTVWDTETGDIARGIAILSLDDEPDDELGRQLAYNKAARCLAGRSVAPITLYKAWEAIQALDPLEMRDLVNNYGMSSWKGQITPWAYIDGAQDLCDDEYNYFARKGYVNKRNYCVSVCTPSFECLLKETLQERV